MTTKHLLGEGYGGQVDEIDGKLIYSLPVDSSYVTLSFEFEITTSDLAKLQKNPVLLKTLTDTLYLQIQNTFGPNIPKDKVRRYRQDEFDLIKNKVLG